MRTRTSIPVAALACWIAALALIAATLSMLAPTNPASAQNEAAGDAVARISTLVPADAATMVAVSTDAESAQWSIAAGLLERGGIDDLVYGALEDGLSNLGIAPANFDPESSSILGGAVAVAFWGEPSDLVALGAAYIAAADPNLAFRSVVAQLLTEGGGAVVESEIPGGRIATDADGFTAVMLLSDIVVISDIDGAQSVMRLVTGSGPTLAEFDPFTTMIEAQETDAIARAYINGPGLGQDLGSLLRGGGLGWQEVALVNVGATLTSTYASVGLTAADDGFHLRVAQLPAPLIGQALPTDAPVSDPAERVSADADVLIAGRDLGANPVLNQYVNSLIFGVGAGWAPYDPSRPASLDEAHAGFEAATGIDIRNEVLDQLRGDFTFALTFKSFDRLSDIDAVLVSEVADPDAVNATLNQIVGALRLVIATEGIDATLSETVVGEDILHVISTSDAAEQIAYSFGLIEGELVMSLGRGYGRLLLPREGETLASDQRYLAARAAASAEDGPFTYVDVHDLIMLSGVEAREPGGVSRITSLDGIQALAFVTHDQGDLTITEIVLTMDGAPPGSSDVAATPDAASD